MQALETANTLCPYCGESIELLVDTSVCPQRYTEDCSVCCRPMVVTVDIPVAGGFCVLARREDDC